MPSRHKIIYLIFCFFITIIATVIITKQRLQKKYYEYFAQTPVLSRKLSGIYNSLKKIEKKYDGLPKELRSATYYPNLLLSLHQPGLSLQKKILQEIAAMAAVVSEMGTKSEAVRCATGTRLVTIFGGPDGNTLRWASLVEDMHEVNEIADMLEKDLSDFLQKYEK